MNIKTTLHTDQLTANAADLAAHYKFQGMERTRAWSQFVIDRALKPEMDAKEFYAIFDSVYPCPLLQTAEVEFKATHWDTLLECDVQITRDDRGVFHLLWIDGHTGAYPPTSNLSDRYHSLSETK